MKNNQTITFHSLSVQQLGRYEQHDSYHHYVSPKERQPSTGLRRRLGVEALGDVERKDDADCVKAYTRLAVKGRFNLRQLFKKKNHYIYAAHFGKDISVGCESFRSQSLDHMVEYM